MGAFFCEEGRVGEHDHDDGAGEPEWYLCQQGEGSVVSDEGFVCFVEVFDEDDV